MRCKHKNTVILTRSENYINVMCNDCKRGWSGRVEPWVSYLGKQHKPPKWVINVIKARDD